VKFDAFNRAILPKKVPGQSAARLCPCLGGNYNRTLEHPEFPCSPSHLKTREPMFNGKKTMFNGKKPTKWRDYPPFNGGIIQIYPLVN